MNHSGLYKPIFAIKEGRRLNEAKAAQKLHRSENFQKSRLIKDVIENEEYFQENLEEKKDNHVIMESQATKQVTIKSKVQRQIVYAEKYNEWKKKNDKKKLERAMNKPKPFVSACFKNPVFDTNNCKELVKINKPSENTDLKFQMKKYVLVTPTPTPTSIINKKNVDDKHLKASTNIIDKKLQAETNIKKSIVINKVPLRQPLSNFNKNVGKNLHPNMVKPLEIKSIKKNQETKVNPPVKSENIQNKGINLNKPDLFKKPLELRNNENKKIHTLKRPPIFLKQNLKSIKTNNQNLTDKVNSLKVKTNESDIAINADAPEQDIRKSLAPLDAITSTSRKYSDGSIPSPLDFEESIIKSSSSTKNLSFEKDFKPLPHSSDENSSPINRSIDFNLNRNDKNKNSIKMLSSKRTSKRLSSKKKRTCCSGDYLIDFSKNTPIQLNNQQTPTQQITIQQTPTQQITIQQTPIQQTPIQHSPKGTINFYMSPQVVVSRGKVSAAKERVNRNSLYLSCVDSPKDSFIKRAEASINYFRSQLKDEEANLLKLCSEWVNYLQSLNSEVIDDVAGSMVNAAIGVTNQLVSKKMKKFECLIERCRETFTTDKFDNVNIANLDDSLKPVKLEDLDGFWMLIRQQIEDLQKRFYNLEKWRDNNWNDPDDFQPIIKKKKIINNVIKKKKATGNNKLKETLKRMRAERLQELKKRENVGINDLNEICEIVTPSKRNNKRKSSNENSIVRRSGRISQIINNLRRSSTPCSSRNASIKKNKSNNTSYLQISSGDMIDFNATPMQCIPRKSILKTPGTNRKNCNVLFHERIAEYKSPEYHTPESRLSLGRTRGSTKRKSSSIGK